MTRGGGAEICWHIILYKHVMLYLSRMVNQPKLTERCFKGLKIIADQKKKPPHRTKQLIYVIYIKSKNSYS